jgi:hypothetical protein
MQSIFHVSFDVRGPILVSAKIAGLFALFVTAPAAICQTYSVIDLGPGEATAINAYGQVAITDYYIAPSKGYLWSGGVRTDIGTLGIDTSVLAINDAGKIAGTSRTASGASRAFLGPNLQA